MVVNFELLHRFESDQKHPGIFKLLHGVYLVCLHHYLLPAVRLQGTHMSRQGDKNRQSQVLMISNLSERYFSIQLSIIMLF